MPVVCHPANQGRQGYRAERSASVHRHELPVRRRAVERAAIVPHAEVPRGQERETDGVDYISHAQKHLSEVFSNACLSFFPARVKRFLDSGGSASRHQYAVIFEMQRSFSGGR